MQQTREREEGEETTARKPPPLRLERRRKGREEERKGGWLAKEDWHEVLLKIADFFCASPSSFAETFFLAARLLPPSPFLLFEKPSGYSGKQA